MATPLPGDSLEAAFPVLEDGILFHKKKGQPVELPLAPIPLADSHGHLGSFRSMGAGTAIARAALAGVRLLVVPVDPVDEVPRKWGSVDELLSWLDAKVETAAGLLVAAAREGIVPPAWEEYASVPDLVDNVHIVAGAHPYGAAGLDDQALRRLDDLLASPRCVGVGEIGLDFGPYNELPADVQEKAFRTQLRVARERDLPVELHIRDGADDTLAHDLAARILAEEGIPARGCDLHCFTQGPEVMAPFVDLGCHVAFGGAATFNRSGDIRSAAVACPSALLLSETDSPYMAPVPLRGLECEPAMVAFSAACVAREREAAGVASTIETYRVLWDNANRLFGLA